MERTGLKGIFPESFIVSCKGVNSYKEIVNMLSDLGFYIWSTQSPNSFIHISLGRPNPPLHKIHMCIMCRLVLATLSFFRYSLYYCHHKLKQKYS